MRPLQVDPAAQLEPIGDPALGLWVPAVVLAVSIAVSALLYWHFARRGPPSS
jgi:hypothetical protein